MEKVTSKDGTKIAYDKVGQGPAVILINGATGTRAGHMTELAGLLSSDLTVFNYDRRGRGDSTDTKPFSLGKEIEDVDALIDAAGGNASLYGISSGGALALEASIKLGGRVNKLAVYEVPYDDSEAGVKAWKEYRAKLADFISKDDRGSAIALFMSFVGVPDDMLEGMRKSPMWQPMEALAPTLEYDAEALGKERKVPTDRAAAISSQTLVLVGGASKQIMPFMEISAKALADVIPNADFQVVEGQSHDVDPKVLAPILEKFFKNKQIIT